MRKKFCIGNFSTMDFLDFLFDRLLVLPEVDITLVILNVEDTAYC